MNYRMYVLKSHLFKILTVSSLTLWALTASLLAIRNLNEVIVIGVDENGTREISRPDDPLLKTETINFIRYFFSCLYNFTPTNFSETVGVAVDLMTPELWATEKEKILSLQENVEKGFIFNRSIIRRISKEGDTYKVYLETYLKEKIKESRQDLVAEIKLRRTERTSKNPWGLEVEKLNENINYN
jgi:hypothetical protein